MKRYYDCAKHYKADIVVRITSDCPLISPSLIDNCIFWLVDGKYDYVGAIEPNYPDGLDTEVFTMELLEKANKEAVGQEREHLVQYFTKQPNSFFPYFNDFPKEKVSLDTMEDYERIKRIWNGEARQFYS
jgi:spore coat polysaccharide biosynthesis protein SpsF